MYGLETDAWSKKSTEVSRVGHHINSLDQWSINPEFINPKSENHINRSGKDNKKKNFESWVKCILTTLKAKWNSYAWQL